MKLLWENPDPSATITTTTITLASDDYDFLIFSVYTGNVVQTHLVKKGMTLQSYYIDNSGYYDKAGDSVVSFSRTFTYINDITYSVGECSARWWVSSSTSLNKSSNREQIPLYVLGVKL